MPAATLRLEVARVAARNRRLMGRVLPPPHLPRADSAAFGHVSTLLAWAQVLHPCPADAPSPACLAHRCGITSVLSLHSCEVLAMFLPYQHLTCILFRNLNITCLQKVEDAIKPYCPPVAAPSYCLPVCRPCASCTMWRWQTSRRLSPTAEFFVSWWAPMPACTDFLSLTLTVKHAA